MAGGWLPRTGEEWFRWMETRLREQERDSGTRSPSYLGENTALEVVDASQWQGQFNGQPSDNEDAYLYSPDDNPEAPNYGDALPDGSESSVYTGEPYEYDIVGPLPPSKPITKTRLGTHEVFWDGLADGAQPMDLDFSYIEVHRSQNLQPIAGDDLDPLPDPASAFDFSLTDETFYDRIYARGSVIVTGTEYGSIWYYRFIAYDDSGNPSDPSPVSDPVVTYPLVDTDIIDKSLSGAKFMDGTIDTAALADGSVSAQKIAQDAIDQIVSEFDIVDAGGVRTTFSPTAPVDPEVNRVWYDTDNENKGWRWDGTQWQPLSAAASVGSSGTTNYYSPDEPPGTDHVVGSTWFDTDNGYKPNRWDGSGWVPYVLGVEAIDPVVIEGIDDALVGVSTEYAVNSSEAVPPATGWATTTPARTPGSFIWYRTTVTRGDGTTSTTSPALLTGNTGAAGAPGSPGTPAAVVNLIATTQVLTAPSTGGATTPATSVVTGTATNTTISAWTYSVDGAAFSATVPTGVSRTGNVVTITGVTMTARTITVRMADANGVSDTLTVAKVSDGAAGGSGTPGAPGADGYTVLLTNEAHTFAGSTTAALAGSTTSSVIAYKGATQQSATIGTITGQVTGLTTAITSNGTTAPVVTVTVTTALTQQSGALTIPVTVDGKVFTKTLAWTVARTGSQGIPGNPGTDGVTLYTWLKYADTPTTGMSDDPTGKTYMGLAYNKTSPTESVVYSDYSWSLIKGADGVPGSPGTDGTTTYTWVKYGTSATGAGLNDSPVGMTYIGLAFNKTTATESTLASDYQWSLIQGPQGNPGNPGAPAATVSLTATTQVLVTPAAGGATNPATSTVTGTALNTTITAWTYSVDGAAFSATVPAGVSRTGNVVTITGSTMTAKTITVKMADAAGVADTLTVAKVADGAAGGSGTPGVPGADGYTVLLTNEAHVFAGSATTALAGSTTSTVIAYKGTVQQSATVGTITGQVTGLTTAITSNGTTAPVITITVTTALVAPNGVLSVPITVDGKVFTKTIAWSVSYKGVQGDPGSAGVSISSVTPYYQQTPVAAAAPALPTTNPPPAPWVSTEPAYVADTALWRTERIVYSNGTFAYTAVTKVSSYAAAAAVAALSVPRIITVGSSKTFFPGFIFTTNTPNLSGSIVIDTPITMTNYMTRIHMEGYNYVPGATEIDVTVGFYSYTTPSFLSTSQTNNGSAPVTVRLARKVATGTVSLILDIAGGVWQYPKVVIDRVDVGYVLPPDSFLNGWSGAVIADTTGYDTIFTPARRDLDETNTLTQSWRTTGQVTIDGGKVTADSITALQIAANAITASEILAGAVTTVKLDALAVTADKIAANAIIAGKIAADAVTTNTLAANAVTAAKIAADTITANEIATNAITANELAANSVVAGDITAGAVVAGNIAANAVTAGTIAADAVTAGTIAAGAVTAGRIAADAVTATTIAAGAVGADELAANSVVAGKIAANAVTAGTIAALSVEAGKIASNAVTADNIAAGAVVAAKISTDALDGKTITGAYVQTEATAARGIKFNTAGLTAYSSTGSVTFSVDASTGNVVAVGTFATATSGGRIVVRPDGDVLGVSKHSIEFYQAEADQFSFPATVSSSGRQDVNNRWSSSIRLQSGRATSLDSPYSTLDLSALEARLQADREVGSEAYPGYITISAVDGRIKITPGAAVEGSGSIELNGTLVHTSGRLRAAVGGTFTVGSVAVNGSASGSVTFPVNSFTSPPAVTVTPGSGRINMAISSVSVTGFNWNCNNWSPASASSSTAYYTAVAM